MSTSYLPVCRSVICYNTLFFLVIFVITSESLFLNFTQDWTDFHQMQTKFAMEFWKLAKYLILTKSKQKHD